MRNLKRVFLFGLITLAVTPLCAASVSPSEADKQPLVTVADETVTSLDLKKAIGSSPFAVQFNIMNDDEQAALRGDMLKRLVTAVLLRKEAEAQGLRESSAFKMESHDFELGLLYRHYMDRLRERIQVPDEKLKKWHEDFKGQPDAFAAAKASYIAERFKAIRQLTIQTLRDRYKVVLHEDLINPQAKDDTLLLEGDGIMISHADLVDKAKYPDANPEWVKEQLYKRGELLLVAKAAAAEGVDVDERLKGFQKERLPSFLRERKEKEWVPDDIALRDYVQSHPAITRIPERWHIGQLVVRSEAEAKQLHARILKGESLFSLAGEFSIDPYGKKNNGDMGWVTEGQGSPEIEQAVKDLKDAEISGIIHTAMGYHLITMLERRPGKERALEEIKDKIRQAIIEERSQSYLHELEKKYSVKWHILEQPSGVEPKVQASR